MTEFKKHGKTSSNWSNSGRKSKVTDKDRRTLKRTVGRNHQTTAAKVTAELIKYLNSPVSTKTVCRELYKDVYNGITAIRKPMLSTIYIQKQVEVVQRSERLICIPMKGSSILRRVNFSLYMWRQPKEDYNPDCLLLTVK